MHSTLFTLAFVALAASVQAAPQFTTSDPPQSTNALASDLVAPGIFPTWSVIPSGRATRPVNTSPTPLSPQPLPSSATMVNNSLIPDASLNGSADGTGDQSLSTLYFLSPGSGNKFALVSSAAGFNFAQAQSTCTQVGAQLADLAPADLLVIAANVPSLAYVGSINGNAYGGSICFAWMPQMFTGVPIANCDRGLNALCEYISNPTQLIVNKAGQPY